MKISFLALTLSLALARADHDDLHPPPPPPSEPINFRGAGCLSYDPLDSGSWSTLETCDDCQTTANLGFTFDAFGTSTNTMEISSNGFIGTYIENDLKGFAYGSNTHVLAPLYGDVFTFDGGVILYKKVPGEDRFAIIYDEIPDSSNVSSRNTFEVVISGVDSNAPQVCLCYKDLDWAYFGSRVEIGVRGQPSDPPWVMADFDAQGNIVGGIFPPGMVLDDLEHRSFCFNLDDLTGPTPPTSHTQIETTRPEVSYHPAS